MRSQKNRKFKVLICLGLISYGALNLTYIFSYLMNKYESKNGQHEDNLKILSYKISKLEEKNFEKSELKNNYASSKFPVTSNQQFLAIDVSGFFEEFQIGIVTCNANTKIEVTNNLSQINNADILFYHMDAEQKSNNNNKTQYTMVYTMESEANFFNADTWINADFHMWFNLDLSYPEPITYFNIYYYLIDLLSPFHVQFENKTNDAPIVWLISNCRAYNWRESYIRRLMKFITVDSYGGCLQNKFTHTAARMHGNVELFSKYKFVIAIENSNCVDYVTEKLIHAVASGSIPIVAGKDNKPDYLKFLPKNSFINIYDYKSAEDLARHINIIASNKTLYESYLPFKRHIYSKDYLKKLKLPELIELAKKIIGPNEKMFSEIVKKEKSEDKLCKIVRYLLSKDEKTIQNEINENRRGRPEINEACLPPGNLISDFQ